MLSGLDNRTLLLVAGTLYVLLPLSTWLVLRWPRQVAPRVWTAGGVIGGIGLLLMGLRGHVPDGLSYVVGQPLLALGAALVAQSLRMDLGRPWPWSWLAAATGLYAGVLAILLPWANASVLGVLIRSVNLGVVLLLVVSAWQVGQREDSRNARTIAGVYGVQALGIMANLWNAILGTRDIQTLASQPVSVAVSLLTLLVALSASMAYLGLALERSVRLQVLSAREHARQQEWLARRDALVALDRERLMTVLTDSLGHAMAQPLTAAMVRVQMAQRLVRAPAQDGPLLQETLGHVVRQLRRTSDTIDQVRQWVRPPRFSTAPVDLSDLLQALGQLLRQEAINRGVRLDWHGLETPVWVSGDGLQLSQAVLQLVRNALQAVSEPAPSLKATARPQVRVQLETAGATARLRVTDNGPGFAQEWLQSMGQDGVRPPQRLQGMGLFVAQSIAHLHQGSLTLSNSVSGGACASLELPALQQVRALAPTGFEVVQR